MLIVNLGVQSDGVEWEYYDDNEVLPDFWQVNQLICTMENQDYIS